MGVALYIIPQKKIKNLLNRCTLSIIGYILGTNVLNIRGYIVHSMLFFMFLLVVLVCLLIRYMYGSCNAPFCAWGRGFAKGEGVGCIGYTIGIIGNDRNFTPVYAYALKKFTPTN